MLLASSSERLERTAEDARALPGAGRVETVVCDLSSFERVKAAAAEVMSRSPRVDALLNNAGMIGSARKLTVDGNEMTFQVNHLSHFLLTCLLRPALTACAPSRVISVSSDAHLAAWRGIRFGDPTMEHGWSPFSAYAHSKLANIMFTYELSRRAAPDGVHAHAMHPGVVSSGIGSGGWGVWGAMWERFVPKLTAEQGAETLVQLATGSEALQDSGLYWFRGAPKRSAPVSRDLEAQKRLWEISARLTGADWSPTP